MDTILWISGSIVAALVFVVLLPVIVVGTWWLVLNAVLQGVDGVCWLLDGAGKGQSCLRKRAVAVKPPVRPSGSVSKPVVHLP